MAMCGNVRSGKVNNYKKDNEMSETNDDFRLSKYPIDIESINKGDYIPKEIVEQITNEKVGTKEFEFARLQLGQNIEKLFKFNRDMVVVLKYRKDGIQILTDIEAMHELEERNENSVRQIRKQAYQIANVDSSKFSLPEIMERDRIAMKIATRKQALSKRIKYSNGEQKQIA